MHVKSIRESERITEALLYLAFLWLEIGLGVTILLVGFDRPLELLIISGSLNLVSMAIYSALLLCMNRRRGLHRSIAIGWWRCAVMLWAVGLYSYFALRFLHEKLRGLMEY